MICILGMHRSGTSCLAGCLEERGLHLGEVVNSAPHNLKGNKENLQLRAINDDVLAYNGCAWDKPPTSLCWDDTLRSRRDEYLQLQGDKTQWGFKDPRTLLTLPFWLEAGVEMQFVGTFRNPASVVASLNKRAGLAPATPPLLLWKQYNLKLLEAVERNACLLVCFDWAADRFLAAIDQISGQYGLSADPGKSMDFFDENLRTGKLEIEVVPVIGDEEQALYERLLSKTVNISSGNESAAVEV